MALMPVRSTFSEAAAIPLTGLTCMQLLHDYTPLSKLRHILVIGASGGTGHVAVQIAHSANVRVTGVCSSRNRGFVAGLGADSVVCYDEPALEQTLRAITAQHGLFDMVFDGVTSHDERDSQWQYERRIRKSGVMAKNALYVLIGGTVADWFRAHVRRFLGLNLFGPSRILHWVRFPSSTATLQQLAKLVDTSKLRVFVSKSFALHEIGDASAYQMSRQAVGKAVVLVSPTHAERSSPLEGDAVVRVLTDCEMGEWTDPNKGLVKWWTLFSGPPTRWG
jgi:NADPH:quinone reductase-like Zn-dependent oxidoreductase